MGLLQATADLTRFPCVYQLWQAPFVDDKFEPLLRRTDLDRARRVLDVGCGPGTNAPFFAHTDYVGIDINQRYIDTARRRHRGTFRTGDIRLYEPDVGERFDFILVNSVLHHLDTEVVQKILASLSRQLTDDGHVHILELVLPERHGIARLLARADRGRFARPLAAWRRIFEDAFAPVVFEPYHVGRCNTHLWEMVYFKGKAGQ